MIKFEEYKNRFKHVKLERQDGVLELTVHTDGGPLRWGREPHDELALAFRMIAGDQENRVMIITGTGDEFSGPRASEDPNSAPLHSKSANEWEPFHANGMELMDALLSIQALVIGAVNGPAFRHFELALLSDIVIASETAEFQDSGHFQNDLTPGDGINILTPLAMGLTRARYFHLMGQVLDAQTALQYGLVNEVVPANELKDRAHAIAKQLLRQRPMVLRHTRLLFTHDLRRRMHDLVGYGLALEGLDCADAYETH